MRTIEEAIALEVGALRIDAEALCMRSGGMSDEAIKSIRTVLSNAREDKGALFYRAALRRCMVHLEGE